MIFRYYVKDNYGVPKKYPADKWSQEALYAVGGSKVAEGWAEHRLAFFGIEMKEVPRSEANYK